MNYYTELNKCIQILHEKPKGFFRKENIAEKLQSFNRIQEFGKGSAIDPLMPFLRSDNSIIREKAAETILFLFGKLKSITDSINCLKYLTIRQTDMDYYRVDFNENTYLQLLRIASLNNDGYIRQRAINEIARLQDVDALWFILYRLGDWVIEVRKTAFEALHSFLKTEHADAFLNKLSEIEWLLIVGRVDLRAVHEQLIQFIFSTAFSNKFLDKVKAFKDKERVLFYKGLSKYHPELYKTQLNNIINDKCFLVRLELLRKLSSFDEMVQKQVIHDFLRDPSPSIRLNALFETKRYAPAYDDNIITLLSDKSALIRDISRRLLKSKGLDFAQIYRDRIAEGAPLLPNLSGLSEMAAKEDLPLFEQNIHSAKSKMTAICLATIRKLNEEKAVSLALQLISHRVTKVQNVAIEILRSRFDEVLEKLRTLYATSNIETRKALLKLYSGMPRWELVPDLLLAALDENAALQKRCWQYLEKWNYSGFGYKTITRYDKDRIKELLEKIDPIQLNSSYEREQTVRYLRMKCEE